MKDWIPVVAAIIVKNDKILIAQRKANKRCGLHWEFPGGKVEPKETPQMALKREIIEELNIDIEVLDFFTKVDFEYDFAKIALSAYFAKAEDISKIKLNDHENIKWVSIDELKNYNLANADAIIVDELLEHHRNNSLFLS